MNRDPHDAAYEAILEVMAKGSDKDGRNESWRTKPIEFHVLKGLRHATTALMQEKGIVPQDGEDHLRLAITRLAMALTLGVHPPRPD